MRIRLTLFAAQISAALLVLPTQAPAQVMPDAGALSREAERTLQAPTAPPQPRAQPARPMAPDAKAARVTVRQIVILGANLIPAQELQAVVADAVGQSLTLQELEFTTQRLAEHYRQRGWYARVYLPQQDVTDGVVRIQVLEGRYSGSTVQQEPGGRADSASVHATVTHRLQAGEPLSAADLERGLLIANDLPGVLAKGLLHAGKEQGETALALDVQDTAFVTGDVGLNNYGVRATGRAQATGGIALNNLSGRGDQFALRMLVAKDIRGGVVRYSLPLGHDGLVLAFNASALDYKLGDAYKDLDAKGKAFTGGFTLSYPLLRQTDRNLSISTGYEYRRYDDDMLQQSLRRPRINAVSLGLNGDMRDNLGGGGINWGGVHLTMGNLNLDGNAGDKALDDASAQSAGRYVKLAWNLGRIQNLGGGWQVQAALSGQLANGNLASSERLSLGGPTQVRAYPVNEASGDQGILLKLELQRNLGDGWQAIAFYDVGHIRQHKHPWDGWNAFSGQPNHYTLSGAGLGLNWRHKDWVMAASVAVPIGSNRGADQDGHNNDGTRASSVRGWLTLSRLF